MQALRLRHTVTSDHQLSLSLPPDFPVGAVEVIVLSEASPLTLAVPPEVQRANDLNGFFEFLKTVPPSGRTAEEIDRQIQDERDSWER